MQKEQQIRNGRSLLKLGKPSTIRLNIMVVGETGSGKTTFLKTLFKLYCGNKIIRAELATKTMKTVKIEEVGFFTLETPALDCEVHLFDSPGYGDYINNQNAIETVKRHLEQAHDAWLTTNGNPMTEKVYRSIYPKRSISFNTITFSLACRLATLLTVAFTAFSTSSRRTASNTSTKNSSSS